MVGNKDDIYYYITVMNEIYMHPEMQKGTELGIIKGMYLLSEKPRTQVLKHKVQLLGSGTILLEVMAAAELLAQDFGIAADVWSVTSFNECGREGADVERWNRLHPLEKQKTSYVHDCLASTEGPVIAATDYMRAYAEQLRVLMPRSYHTLGTDGFGRSDTRKQLRRFFEVDRFYVVLTALQALSEEGTIDKAVVAKAIKQYNIHPDKLNPTTV
jgi:pyruvate dehydrogenase E1 component